MILLMILLMFTSKADVRNYVESNFDRYGYEYNVYAEGDTISVIVTRGWPERQDGFIVKYAAIYFWRGDVMFYSFVVKVPLRSYYNNIKHKYMDSCNDWKKEGNTLTFTYDDYTVELDYSEGLLTYTYTIKSVWDNMLDYWSRYDIHNFGLDLGRAIEEAE